MKQVWCQTPNCKAPGCNSVLLVLRLVMLVYAISFVAESAAQYSVPEANHAAVDVYLTLMPCVQPAAADRQS